MLELGMAAFAAGLLGGVHCLGMCGSFAVASAGGGSGRSKLGNAATHTLGRVTTYVALGALAGTVGSVATGWGWVGLAISGVLLAYFTLRLAGIGPAVRIRIPWVSRLAARSAKRGGFLGRYFFGVANGLLPCGLVYAALAMPIASGTTANGALVMLAFGIGTAPTMMGAAVLGGSLGRAPMGLRRALAVAILVGGVWSLVHRVPVEAVDGQAAVPECCRTEPGAQ
jgi:sulfite exporter TauE/SafE